MMFTKKIAFLKTLEFIHYSTWIKDSRKFSNHDHTYDLKFLFSFTFKNEGGLYVNYSSI